MLAMALKPFGVRSFVGLMKLPAALLTRPVPPPVTRMRLPLRRSSLNMRAPRVGARILSRDLHLGGCIRRLAIAEGPVFLGHLDQVDPGVLPAHAEHSEVVSYATEERALLGERAAGADGELDDHDVVGARDAEVARVVDQVARLVLAQDLEAVAFRYADRLDQRAMHRVAQLAAELRRAPLAERDAHQRQGVTGRAEPRASATGGAAGAAPRASPPAARAARRSGGGPPRSAHGVRGRPALPDPDSRISWRFLSRERHGGAAAERVDQRDAALAQAVRFTGGQHDVVRLVLFGDPDGAFDGRDRAAGAVDHLEGLVGRQSHGALLQLQCHVLLLVWHA